MGKFPLATLIQVRFSVRKGREGTEVKGAITVDPADRDKIVFLDGYRPERESSWRGILPKDGEEWICLPVRDTQEGILHRGALIVRLQSRVEERFELRPEGPRVFGVQQRAPWKVRGLVEEKMGAWQLHHLPPQLQAELEANKGAWVNAVAQAKAELEKFAFPRITDCLSTLKVPAIIGGCSGEVVSLRDGFSRLPWRFIAEGQVICEVGKSSPSIPGIGTDGIVHDYHQVVVCIGLPTSAREEYARVRFSWQVGDLQISPAMIWETISGSFPIFVEIKDELNEGGGIVANLGVNFGSCQVLTECPQRVGTPENRGKTVVFPARLEPACPPEARKVVEDRLRVSRKPIDQHQAEWELEALEAADKDVRALRHQLASLVMGDDQFLRVEKIREDHTYEYVSPDEMGTRIGGDWFVAYYLVVEGNRFPVDSILAYKANEAPAWWSDPLACREALIHRVCGEIRSRLNQAKADVLRAVEWYEEERSSDLYSTAVLPTTDLDALWAERFLLARNLEDQASQAIDAALAFAKENSSEKVAARKAVVEAKAKAELHEARSQAEFVRDELRRVENNWRDLDADFLQEFRSHLYSFPYSTDPQEIRQWVIKAEAVIVKAEIDLAAAKIRREEDERVMEAVAQGKRDKLRELLTHNWVNGDLFRAERIDAFVMEARRIRGAKDAARLLREESEAPYGRGRRIASLEQSFRGINLDGLDLASGRDIEPIAFWAEFLLNKGHDSEKKATPDPVANLVKADASQVADAMAAFKAKFGGR